MPLISFFYGISIYLYFRDHNPPHFHAEYAEFEAKISIETLTITKGYLPDRALKLIKEWASKHQQELIDNWEKVSVHGLKPSKIAPLD